MTDFMVLGNITSAAYPALRELLKSGPRFKDRNGEVNVDELLKLIMEYAAKFRQSPVPLGLVTPDELRVLIKSVLDAAEALVEAVNVVTANQQARGHKN